MTNTVLILDDDSNLLNVMGEFLEILGSYKTVRLKSYEDMAQKSAEALNSDVAFLDVNLGAACPSGIDSYHWLREHGYKGRIFFLTGHAQSHPMVIEAKHFGDAQVLSKPVDGDLLLSLARGDS